MKIAIFLGAGASRSCGIPLQNELLRDYFVEKRGKISSLRNTDEIGVYLSIKSLFENIFGINVDTIDKNTLFPTFEEVLGMLDLAFIKRENFRGVSLSASGGDDGMDITNARNHLIYLIADIVAESIKKCKNNNHKRLLEKISKDCNLNNVIYISTNYDLLIDEAIYHSTNSMMPNYGFSLKNHQRYKAKKRKKTSDVKLFKLHGSFNWLYCPLCKTIFHTYLDYGTTFLCKSCTDINSFEDENVESYLEASCYCEACDTLLQPVIIPPTYFKDYANYYLNTTWHQAALALQKVDRILFCGYSFPDADIYIKYLLKQAETMRDKPFEVYVFNNHFGKKAECIEAEKERYNRFFKEKVCYTDLGFGELVECIENYVK